jgi:hypothetical protein
MAWKLSIKSGNRYSTLFYYVHDKKIGITAKEHTCQDCGFIGHFSVSHCKDWWALVFIPIFPMKDYYLSLCPKCKTDIPVNFDDDFIANPIK